MRSSLAVVPIVAVAVLACSGPCWRQPADVLLVETVPWDELTSALGPSGRLSPDACEALCSGFFAGHDVDEVHACWFPSGATATDLPDSGGTGASWGADVACDVTGTEICKG